MQPKTIMEKNCKGPSINDVGNWEGEGVKNWSKFPTYSTKILPILWEGGVKISEKLLTLLMDGTLVNRSYSFSKLEGR